MLRPIDFLLRSASVNFLVLMEQHVLLFDHKGAEIRVGVLFHLPKHDMYFIFSLTSAQHTCIQKENRAYLFAADFDQRKVFFHVPEGWRLFCIRFGGCSLHQGHYSVVVSPTDGYRLEELCNDNAIAWLHPPEIEGEVFKIIQSYEPGLLVLTEQQMLVFDRDQKEIDFRVCVSLVS